MKHILPALPYEKNALEPYISKETLDYHHGKHHRGYINTLNALIVGSEFADTSLEEIILNAKDEIFNNAAQVWNHNFYWQCLSPAGGGRPSGRLAKAIEAAFNSFAAFKNQFTQIAEKTFGSGWVWLVHNQQGALSILSTHNAGTPM
ncbi:MAG: superoxide dismutase [Fe], partial [Gammaproteobacteria bacterium]|nr:superoxide dismutase [Fe] [Gammaproteobacteria bacterium]